MDLDLDLDLAIGGLVTSLVLEFGIDAATDSDGLLLSSTGVKDMYFATEFLVTDVFRRRFRTVVSSDRHAGLSWPLHELETLIISCALWVQTPL